MKSMSDVSIVELEVTPHERLGSFIQWVPQGSFTDALQAYVWNPLAASVDLH
jgi:hypothetical protein